MSVVISTLERAESLCRTLLALRYQAFADFEVIVVDGPARDDVTRRAIEDRDWGVRYLRCPEQNLSRARNIGIRAAGGDVVAFVDDDAIPQPDWLAQLVAAYDRPEVGGSGGVVYDGTGVRLQYRYSLSDRVGRTSFEVERPPEESLRPGADPLVYLQGTNMSFRRAVLAEIGGFDEEIEYNYDEVEVCLCVLDSGLTLRPLSDAGVLHKSLPSPVRGEGRALTDPYTTIKNRAYFALRYGTASRPEAEVLAAVQEYARELALAGSPAGGSEPGSDAAAAWYRERVRAGLAHGLAAGRRGRRARDGRRGRRAGVGRRGRRALPGLRGGRRSARLGSGDPGSWRPYSRLVPAGGRRRIAVLGTDSGPEAHELAGQGHDVHVLEPLAAGAVRRRDFEEGVWWHAYPVHDRRLDALAGDGRRHELYAAAAAWHELAALDGQAPLDEIRAADQATSLLALREELARELAERSPHGADQVLEQLLDPTTYPQDRAAELRRAWDEPPAQFITAVYRAILERAPAASEVEQWVTGSGEPNWRRDVTRLVAGSAEARGLQRPGGPWPALD